MKKKDVFVSAIKGFMMGIASWISGMSLSSMLLSTSSYNNFIKGMSNPKKEKKLLNFFVIPLVIGIILGIIAGSHLINFFWTKYKLQTIILFVGLLIGGIRVIYVKQNITLKKNSILIPIVIMFLTIALIFMMKNHTFVIKNSVINTIVVAFITGVSCIIPGVSVYSARIKYGYKAVLSATTNPTSFNNILIILAFVIILAITITLLAKLIAKCLDKNKNTTYIVLCSLLLSNILVLLIQIDKFQADFINIFTSLLAFLWGYIFAKNVERE